MTGAVQSLHRIAAFNASTNDREGYFATKKDGESKMCGWRDRAIAFHDVNKWCNKIFAQFGGLILYGDVEIDPTAKTLFSVFVFLVRFGATNVE